MNRMTNKELPRPEPKAAKLAPSVQAVIAREVQDQHDQRQRNNAAGFLDKFFALFADYSYSTARSHKRKPWMTSTRKPEEIVAEVRAFFAQRPRPWRPAGNRQRPVHAQRYRYRRAP